MNNKFVVGHLIVRDHLGITIFCGYLIVYSVRAFVVMIEQQIEHTTHNTIDTKVIMR